MLIKSKDFVLWKYFNRFYLIRIQLGHKLHECTKKCLGEENRRKSKDSTENISIESIR